MPYKQRRQRRVVESVDHGDASERRQYLHDKHSGADTNRGSQQAVPI